MMICSTWRLECVLALRGSGLRVSGERYVTESGRLAALAADWGAFMCGNYSRFPAQNKEGTMFPLDNFCG
jgi:hypothetical protein